MKLIRYFILFAHIAIFAQENKIYLMYENYPQQVYKNQVFEVKLKLLTNNSDFEHIETLFENKPNIKILNPLQEWVKHNEDTFFNNYYMRILDTNENLPNITVNAISYTNIEAIDNEEEIEEQEIATEDEQNKTKEHNANDIYGTGNSEYVLIGNKKKVITSSYVLPSKAIKVHPIKWGDNHSNLVASNFKIINYEVEQYDKDINIVAIEIETKYSNLHDFTINNKSIIKQNIKPQDATLPYFRIVYYAAIDKKAKEFKFNYFDFEKSKFIYESLPIALEQETISTQTDINPKKSNFEFIKIIAIVVVILIFTTLLVFRKKKIYIVAIAIMVALLVFILIPLETILLPKGAKIKILPIEKSTIFLILDKQTEAKIIKSQHGFLKVIFNDKMGWVDEQIINKD